MAFANTRTHYGSVTRAFHWVTAALILTAVPLGLIAHNIPLESDAQVAQKTLLFSIHKTVGVTAFFVALARILWALTQPRPAALHPDRKAETFLAATIHWSLYASLVLVPLSGWLHHAATTGFAPIWWPFGQSLPFVPIDFRVAEFFAAWHWLFTKILAGSLLLHIAGAIKHVVIDRDATLARMTTGRGEVTATDHAEGKGPILAAALVWAVAIGAGSAMGLAQEQTTDVAVTEAEDGNWTILDGSLAITVRQLGSDVTGGFSDWSARVTFDPESSNDIKGSADVSIDITSLDLGTVTEQAMGADFFDSATFATASYGGDIIENPEGDGYIVQGTLALKGAEIAVDLPFEFLPTGDLATVSGTTVLDRRDFGIGGSITDEESLANSVTVTIDLIAERQF